MIASTITGASLDLIALHLDDQSHGTARFIEELDYTTGA